MITQFQQLIQNSQHGHSAKPHQKNGARNSDVTPFDPDIQEELPTELGPEIQPLLLPAQFGHDLISPNAGLRLQKECGDVEGQDSADIKLGDGGLEVGSDPIVDMASALLAGALLPNASGQAQPELPVRAQTLRAIGLEALSNLQAADVVSQTPAILSDPPAAEPKSDANFQMASRDSAILAQTVIPSASLTEATADSLGPDYNPIRATLAEQTWHMRFDDGFFAGSNSSNPELTVTETAIASTSALTAEADQQSSAAPLATSEVQVRPLADITVAQPMAGSLSTLWRDSTVGSDLNVVKTTPIRTDEQRDSVKKLKSASALEKVVVAVPEKSLQPDSIALKEQLKFTEETLPAEKNDSEVAVSVALEHIGSDAIGNSAKGETQNLGIQGQIAKMEKLQSPHESNFSAPTIVKQLVQHSSAAKDGGVELIVSPAELGHVKFQIHQQADNVRIVLSAERSDTLDLLRRNAEQLLQEFKQSGFSDASLSFSQWNQKDGNSQQPVKSTIFFDADVELNSSILVGSASISNALPPGRGLDLRL